MARPKTESIRIPRKSFYPRRSKWITLKVKRHNTDDSRSVEARALSDAAAEGRNLKNVIINCRDLAGASLTNARLSGAEFNYADLRRADLRNADLCNADLRNADLRNADLCSADLRNADLRNADLCSADLSGANLCGAKLASAVTDDKTVLPYLSILPEGALIAWKRLRSRIVAKLEIPANAKRVNSTERKCRAACANVLALYRVGEIKPLPRETTAVSFYDKGTVYRTGLTIRPDKFDPDWRKTCAPGIHFFITREEAEAFVY